MDIQKEIIALRRELEKHNRLYYVEVIDFSALLRQTAAAKSR